MITNYQQMSNKILYSLPLHKFKRYLNDITQRSTLYRKSSNIYLYILYSRYRFSFPTFVTRGILSEDNSCKTIIVHPAILYSDFAFTIQYNSFTSVRCGEHFMDTSQMLLLFASRTKSKRSSSVYLQSDLLTNTSITIK